MAIANKIIFSGQCKTLAILAISLTLATNSAMAVKGKARGGGGGVYLTTPEPTNPLEHNNRAVELGMKGLWDASIREHQIALEGDPFNKMFERNLSGAELRYADVLASKKNYTAAIEHYRRALFADQNNGSADNNLDNCLARLGKNPNDVGYRLSLADGADGSGHYIDAVVEYRKCLKLSDSGATHYKLGRCMVRNKRVTEGYQELLDALRKSWSKDDPVLVDCLIFMGDTLKEFAYQAKNYPDKSIYLKRLNNSYMCYRRASMLAPNNGQALQGLTETAREAVAMNPSFRNILALASAYLVSGDYDRAKINYEKAWRLDPTNPDLIKARMSFHQAVVESPLSSPLRREETMQKVKDMLDKDPNNVLFLYILGKGNERQGNNEEALSLYEKAMSISKFAVPALVPAYEHLKGGPDKVADGKTPDGKPIDGKATEPKVDKAAAEKAKADAEAAKALEKIDGMIKEGKLEDADKELDAILNTQATNGKAWYLKGTLAEKKGALDDASVCYRQAASLKEAGAEDNLRRISESRVKPLLDEADKMLSEKKQVEAVELYREAARMAPNLVSVQRKLLDMLKQMGESKEADKVQKKLDELEKAK
ncbi:MAG: hypothetical protein IPP97_03235 [Candidatus Obscuribacter sp.]|nr:hypothetical protein [Candidatus Obscuribacter sp.]MBP6595033.1 hypothetical protein [Candidatus Obscuribacter sp.]MBP7578572.1 hypothetical protein [Candidatus Obscuribacter sp.]